MWVPLTSRRPKEPFRASSSFGYVVQPQTIWFFVVVSVRVARVQFITTVSVRCVYKARPWCLWQNQSEHENVHNKGPGVECSDVSYHRSSPMEWNYQMASQGEITTREVHVGVGQPSCLLINSAVPLVDVMYGSLYNTGTCCEPLASHESKRHHLLYYWLTSHMWMSG